MLKRIEQTDPSSCLNRADADEMIFVLLGRDPAVPATIRFWMNERIRLGENGQFDSQIMEAERCAQRMEAEIAGKDGKP